MHFIHFNLKLNYVGRPCVFAVSPLFRFICHFYMPTRISLVLKEVYHFVLGAFRAVCGWFNVVQKGRNEIQLHQLADWVYLYVAHVLSHIQQLTFTPGAYAHHDTEWFCLVKLWGMKKKEQNVVTTYSILWVSMENFGNAWLLTKHHDSIIFCARFFTIVFFFKQNSFLSRNLFMSSIQNRLPKWRSF